MFEILSAEVNSRILFCILSHELDYCSAFKLLKSSRCFSVQLQFIGALDK